MYFPVSSDNLSGCRTSPQETVAKIDAEFVDLTTSSCYLGNVFSEGRVCTRSCVSLKNYKPAEFKVKDDDCRPVIERPPSHVLADFQFADVVACLLFPAPDIF